MRKSVLLLAAAAATCVVGSSSIVQASDSVEYVYVESNIATAKGNSIYAFRRGSDGHLQQIAGSPFLTGGAGIQYSGFNLGPFDSDQEIITNANHTLLFAVNAGSDSVAVFHIEDNGALKPVDGSPFPSGGADPVSLALKDNILFIANQSGDFGRPTTVLRNYTAMRLEPDGILVPISSKTNDSSHSFDGSISTASGGSPSQVFLVPGSNLLFGNDFLSGLIHPFRFDGDGQLHAMGSIALPATEFTDTTTPRLPLGLWSHPTQPILYVGYVMANKIGVYRFSTEGSLQFIRTVPNAGKGICWIRANNSGSRLYTTDTATNQVSVYDTSDPEFPVEIQTFTLSGAGQAFQESLSEDGSYLYTISQRSSTSTPAGQGNVLHTLVIQSDGTVSETAPPVDFNQPGGARPQGVAVVDR